MTEQTRATAIDIGVILIGLAIVFAIVIIGVQK